MVINIPQIAWRSININQHKNSRVERQISKSLCLLFKIDAMDDELVQIVGSGDELNNSKALETWVSNKTLPDSCESSRARLEWLGEQLKADIDVFHQYLEH